VQWTEIVLATDEDLRNQESRMPEAARQTLSKGGFYAYDGKRDLAKADIGNYLRRRGTDPNYLLDPSQLNRAAVFLELAYIYRDLANRNDTVSAEKARVYQQFYDYEIENLFLDSDAPAGSGPTTTIRPMIPMRRG